MKMSPAALETGDISSGYTKTYFATRSERYYERNAVKMSDNKKSQLKAGMKSGIPIIFGFIPVGIAYAIMARRAGFSAAETVFMSIAVFAGASQMMAAGMYAQGAGVVAMILTTFILNLRHLIMSTCIMNKLRSEKIPVKLLAAFGVTDESFAVFTTEKQENCTIAYFLGLIAVTYLSWVTGSAIGAFASDFLPPILTASLGIALYAMFIALLMPNLKHNFRLGLLAVLTAIMNTVLSKFMSSSWALIVSTLICAAIGVFFVDPDKREDSADER